MAKMRTIDSMTSASRAAPQVPQKVKQQLRPAIQSDSSTMKTSSKRRTRADRTESKRDQGDTKSSTGEAVIPKVQYTFDPTSTEHAASSASRAFDEAVKRSGVANQGSNDPRLEFIFMVNSSGSVVDVPAEFVPKRLASGYKFLRDSSVVPSSDDNPMKKPSSLVTRQVDGEISDTFTALVQWYIEMMKDRDNTQFSTEARNWTWITRCENMAKNPSSMGKV